MPGHILRPKMLHGQGVSSKAAKERNRLIKKVVLVLLVITLSALFCVWSRVRVVQLGYEISNLQNESKELTTRMNHLKLEIERLKSPTRLEKVATKMLGMHAPASEEMVFVKKEGM